MADLAGHEAKCAGCREYFRPDRLRQEKNAYYCRSCYGILKRKEKICPVCRRVLTPYDPATRDGGFSYCPDCYDRVTGPNGAAGEIADVNAHCSECGKSLAPEEARALYANNCYCIACYEKSAPYLDAKPFWLQPGDAVAAMRTGREVRCSKCNRDLGPLDVKVRDGKSIYCEKCYRDARGASENHRFYVAERAGMITRPGVTAVREGADLVECANCGWVITRDRLGTMERDARGRLRCAHCGKKFEAPTEQAPEKPKPAKMGTEDFAITAQLFKCLGDPCRVKIIESLSEKELCVFEFVELTGSQYSAISYHLKMLKELGIVWSYERGNFVVYSLTDKGQIVHEFIRKSQELK